MKKKIKLLLSFIMLWTIFLINVSLATEISINTATLNIRENPSTSAKILNKAYKNEKYSVLEEKSEWLKINKNGVTGWINKEYVVTIEENISTTYKVVTTSKLNLREIPSINGNKITVLSKGDVVEVLETKNGWDKIKISTKTGWASNEYLEKTTQTSNVGTSVATQKTVIVTTGTLNIRKEASTSSEKVGTVGYGNAVTVISELNEWYKIKYNNIEGYIYKQYTTERNADIVSRGSYERNSVSSKLAEKAKDYLGYKYVYGAESPSVGFDCSGLVYYLYKSSISNFPRGATSQSKLGEYVEKVNLQKGDLIYFSNNTSSNIQHVGIYLENGNFIHAANPSRGVVIDTINSGYYYNNYLFAKRIL